MLHVYALAVYCIPALIGWMASVSAALHPAVPVVPQMERSGRSRKRRTPYTSDAESVRTEEFELRFQVRILKKTFFWVKSFNLVE